MKHSREKHDTTSLVRSGERYRHKVKESGDAERRLHVHYRKCGGRSTQCCWGERRALSCAAARREEQCRREIG